MRSILLLLCLVLVSSCTFMKEDDATFIAVGGKGAYRKGVGVVWQNEKSFRDAALAAAAAATGYFGAANTAAKEVTAQVASKQSAQTAQKAAEAAARVKIQESADAVRKAEIAAGLLPSQ